MHTTSKHRLCDTTNAKQGARPVPQTKENAGRRNELRNRNVHVQLWLSQKEADALSHNAKKCCLSQSAYLRHLITGFVPNEHPPLDYYAMMRQLYGLTNNLNQIAEKAHVLNVIDAQRYDRYAKIAEQAILNITKAVVEPKKMNEEEHFETSTTIQN